MNRLLRAGFSSRAIYKVLREWNLPEEAVEGMEAGGAADSDTYAEPEERAGDSDTYAKQNEEEE
jgi:regulatory protein